MPFPKLPPKKPKGMSGKPPKMPSFGAKAPLGDMADSADIMPPKMSGPAKKPKGFQAMSAPGNSDFGLIGSSAPSPMTPTKPKKPRKITF